MPSHTLAERRRNTRSGTRKRITSGSLSRSRLSSRLSGALARKRRTSTSRPGGGRRRIAAGKGRRR